MKADRDQEPVLKLAGGLRRGILAVTKAALAARSAPQRAVRNEPTPATGKRPAARRVFGQKAVWLRCSSVTDRWRVCSLVAPRHPAFCPKTGSLRILKQALRENVRLCSPMFAYLRLMGKKCLRRQMVNAVQSCKMHDKLRGGLVQPAPPTNEAKS